LGALEGWGDNVNGQPVKLKRLRAGLYWIEGTDWAIVRSAEAWVGTRGGMYDAWGLASRAGLHPLGEDDWCIENLGWRTLREVRQWVARNPYRVGLGL
jgi:hypothetical protein